LRVIDREEAICWLCSRPLGKRVEYHHPVPKSRGGRDTVAVHPICHRTLHRIFSNAELGLFGASAAALRADPRMARFLAWIGNKEPDFHAPTHRRR
jgi:5-methylcytosine-specific restriction endonuclease McrA